MKKEKVKIRYLRRIDGTWEIDKKLIFKDEFNPFKKRRLIKNE